MPAATRLGDLNTGHDLCAPVALGSASHDVVINGKGAGRVGDVYVTHGCKSHPDHNGTIASGSATVFINGMAAGRVGDPVSCGGSVAAGSSDVNIGDGDSESEAVERSFQIVDEVVSNSAYYTEGDEVILATPQIALSMANKENELDKQGWTKLSELLKIWTSSKAYTYYREDEENQRIKIVQLDLDWSWYMSYSRFYTAYRTLIDDLVLSLNAQTELIGRLKADGVWENGGEFDFSAKPKEEWINWYYTSKVVNNYLHIGPDGMDALLAGHSIRLLAKGNVTVDSEHGFRTVELQAVYPYVYDTFNFSGTDNYYYWSIEAQDMKLTSGDGYYHLTNSDFKNFRDKYGTGKDFVVLSQLGPVCELSGKSFIVPLDEN